MTFNGELHSMEHIAQGKPLTFRAAVVKFHTEIQNETEYTKSPINTC